MNAIVLLFLTGILFMVFEVLTPGGILGVMGAIIMAIGCGVAFYQFGPETGAATTGIAIVVLGLTIWVELWLLPRTRLGRKLFQNSMINAKTQPPIAESSAVVGKSAETVTTLAPTGYVMIEGSRYEAFSQSGYIPKGATVRVIGLDNFRLIVTQSPST